MIDQQAIDKLAAFCRLADKGYRRDREGDWLDENNFVWDPFGSDDDCRVVLEAVPEDKRSALLDAMYDLSGADDDRYDMLSYLTVFEHFLLYASPREKCLAVARVLGDA